MAHVFIGLGPQGHTIAKGDVAALVGEVDGGATMCDWRGHFATFALSSPQAVNAVVEALNGHMIGDVRLVVRADRRQAPNPYSQHKAAGSHREQHSHPTAGSGAQLFVGLGPNGSSVSAAALTQVVSQVTKPLSVIMHPRFAVVTVDPSCAQAVIDHAQGQFIGNVKLSIRADRSSATRHQGPINNKRLYIGLGPNGFRVPMEALRAACEDVAPLVNFEAARFCAFADVAREEDGRAMIDALNGTTFHGCRLVVRHFHE